MPPPVLPYVGPGSDPVSPPSVHPGNALDVINMFDPFYWASGIDISKWFEPLFPQPKPPQPMQKGNPQPPASENMTPGVLATVPGTGWFTPEFKRDLVIYLAAALLVVIAVSAALR